MQNIIHMDPFIAYGGARPSAGLGHVCSCLFSETRVIYVATGWPHDHGPTNVGAMVKTKTIRRQILKAIELHLKGKK